MPATSVCFVVTEILGTAPTGGIATATSHAALVLARAGYDVEVLYCGPDPALQPSWQERYAEAGVHFRRLDRSTHVEPPVVADSYRLYEQLRRNPPDVVVLQDWLGLGFCAGQARRAGELARTKLVHIVHGPGDWLRLANLQQKVDAADLAVAWMERRSAELADAVVGPSEYLLGWMASEGWRLPPSRHVIPYFTEGHVRSVERPLGVAAAPAPLEELVFFGRLEERKGVRVFAEALNLVGPGRLRGLGVTFLGRQVPLSAPEVEAMLLPGVRAAVDIRFEPDLDQAGARRYLAAPGRVAVVPSLLDNSPNVVYECLEDRVPLLASGTGGTAELVAPADRDRVLFEPTPAGLAVAVERLLDEGLTPVPAAPAFDGEVSLAAWRRVLDEPARATADTSAPPDARVGVVIPHHDQGRHLPEAVASAAGQRGAAIEVVVVDDGSTDPESLHALAEVERATWACPVRVVRQENRYLGAARNAGVASTDAPYVAFCDDDDVLDPAFVSTLLGVAVRTGAAAVVCALRNREVDDDGDLRHDVLDPVWTFLDGAPAVGTIWNTFGGAGMLVRRDALLAVGGFHEHRGVGHEDWDLLARLVLAGHEVLTVPATLYHYRIRPGSMIRTTSQYRNAARVNDSYAAHLATAVATWPALVRGQHLLLHELRSEVESLQAEVERLELEVDRRNRLLEVLGSRR